MSDATEQRITEWAQWFHYNKDRPPRENLLKRLEFLEKTVDGLLEIAAIQQKDIQFLERRDPLRKLWLPTGMEVRGDVRKMGLVG